MKTPRLVALAARGRPGPARRSPRARRASRGPIFGTQIEIINLSLSVTDARNNFVTDLAQSDFAVFEDGIRQELSLFTHENLPISLVLMIDTSASMEEKLKTAQDAAIRFTKTLRPQDLAQVVQFNERATPLQTFTNDLAALEKAIRSTEASGPTALHNALYVALKDLTRDKKAAELRRRAIILLSDGEDTASLVTDDQVLDLARKSEINIYAISLRPQRAQDRQRAAFSQAEYLFNALTRDTGGPRLLPGLARRARRGLRPDRRGAADALQRRLRLLERCGATASGAASWCACPSARALQVRHKLGYLRAAGLESRPADDARRLPQAGAPAARGDRAAATWGIPTSA